jgi:hypothetical protein
MQRNDLRASVPPYLVPFVHEKRPVLRAGGTIGDTLLHPTTE